MTHIYVTDTTTLADCHRVGVEPSQTRARCSKIHTVEIVDTTSHKVTISAIDELCTYRTLKRPFIRLEVSSE